MATYGKGEFGGFSSYQTGDSPRTTGGGGGSELSRLTNAISSNIQTITQNVSQIQNNVSRIGTPQDSDEIRERVHQLTHHTNQVAKETNKLMKDLAHLTVPAAEQSKWRMQRDRLTDDFSTALKNFQTIQRTAAEKERASVARARAQSGNFPKSPFDDDTGRDDLNMTPGFSQTRQVLQMEEDVDLDMLHEREAAIKQLESDITDVNQIFKDLGMLVHEQGEMLVQSTQKKVYMCCDPCGSSSRHRYNTRSHARN
ncbi:syntaxin-7 isoform X5 [Magallana gigas]|uniref:syntaxin-7 isoform X5 n=1 Tax=Magallana gigas TaxID=29159 RepID=UPI0033406C03